MALWNRDCTDYPDLNLYGSHPFLMEVRPGDALTTQSHHLAIYMDARWQARLMHINASHGNGPASVKSVQSQTLYALCTIKHSAVLLALWCIWDLKNPRGLCDTGFKAVAAISLRSTRCTTSAAADGSAHGVLLWNSNGMDAVVTEDYVSFRVTGGVLDMYFFLGPTPMEVLEQYTRLFGRPALPPLWALGFHQSK